MVDPDPSQGYIFDPAELKKGGKNYFFIQKFENNSLKYEVF